MQKTRRKENDAQIQGSRNTKKYNNKEIQTQKNKAIQIQGQ